MSDVIFVRTRHEYTSYTDYWKLVELSGFPVIYVDEIPPEGVKDKVFIVTPLNGEWQNGIQTDGRVVCYDLEWHLDGIPPIPGLSELWAADKWYADCIGAKYVPMGSHPDLCPELSAKQDIYDVAFIGYFDGVPRRQRIRNQLVSSGVRVSPPGAWGNERHTLLRNSAAYLHVHQLEGAPTIAPLRMVVAAAYALPYISETVADAGLFRPHIFQADYGHLVNAVVHWTRQESIYWEKDLLPRGMELCQRLCYDFTFRKSVENAL